MLFKTNSNEFVHNINVRMSERETRKNTQNEKMLAKQRGKWMI